MAASKKVKISADTTELSASLSRVDNSGKNIARSLGRSVPVLGQMTSAAGVIGVAVGGIVSNMQRWVQLLERGNREQEKAVTGARQLVAETGDFEHLAQFREHAAIVSTRGTVSAEGLIAGVSAMRGAVPDMDARSTAGAMPHMQRAGTAGFDVAKVSRIAGILLQHDQVEGGTEAERIANAFDFAAYIMSAMGAAADEAANALPRLFMLGMSLEEALSAYSMMRGMDTRSRSTAIRALTQFRGRRIRGADHAARIISRHPNFSRADLPEPGEIGEVEGFVGRALQTIGQDPTTMASIGVGIARNLEAEVIRMRANEELMLQTGAQAIIRGERPGAFDAVNQWINRNIAGPSAREREWMNQIGLTASELIQSQSQYVAPE